MYSATFNRIMPLISKPFFGSNFLYYFDFLRWKQIEGRYRRGNIIDRKWYESENIYELFLEQFTHNFQIIRGKMQFWMKCVAKVRCFFIKNMKRGLSEDKCHLNFISVVFRETQSKALYVGGEILYRKWNIFVDFISYVKKFEFVKQFVFSTPIFMEKRSIDKPGLWN